MNEVAPFTPALAFIKRQLDVPDIFTAEELPVSTLNLLPYTKEEEVLYYLLTLPSLTSLVKSECGSIWEPWNEPLSKFIDKHPNHKIIKEFDDRRLKSRQKNLMNWIISLCDWNENQLTASTSSH